jgi:hypothetical protein
MGDSYSTRVELVIRDAEGDEVRYPIPNCVSVSWTCTSQRRAEAPGDRKAQCTLELHRVHLKTTSALDVSGLHVNDLLAEIAAGKLDNGEK